MKKVYLLAALLAFSSGAFAHPCNPDDKDFDGNKCAVLIERAKLYKEMETYKEWLKYQKMMSIKVPVLPPKDPSLKENFAGSFDSTGGIRGGL